MMRAALIIAFLTTVYTSCLHADLTLRYDAVLPNKQQPLHSVAIKRDRVRISQLQGYRPPALVLNLASGEMIQLDDRNRAYFKIDTQTLNSYLSIYRSNQAMIQGLINQGMQHLAPEQRAEVEKMVKQLQQPPKTSASMIKPTSKTQQVLGFNCRVISLFEQNRHTRDICISDYRQLDLADDDRQSLEQLRQFVLQFRESAPVPQQDLIDFVVQGMEQSPGIPLKVVNYNARGEIRNVIQLGNISTRPIDRELYQIPRHYREQMTPVLSSRW
ncbi:MAG: hypothetical protein QNJ69_01360 [Gammaproteobacteria bacterium]|nr:hypothetical protein [Gammaproteobacteria bacterium]